VVPWNDPAMPLDYNSLLIAIAFAAACLGITLFAAWLSARREAFLLTWAVGALLLVVSVLIYSAYVISPEPAVVILAFFLHIMGFAVLYGAARQFRTGESPLRVILVAGVPALLVALPGFATRFDAIGFVLSNLVVASLLFLTAREYWVGRKEAPGPIMGLTALYAVAGLSFIPCAVVLVIDGQLEVGRAPENWAENLNLVVGIAAVAGVGALSLALNQSRLARSHRREAMTDALTGLLNRRAVFDMFSERDLPPFTSVIVFDLDGFKAVNDGHGHAVGDEVLRRFASAIKAGIRASDTAARLGGEEFALVLPRSDAESALQVAERIRRTFAEEAIETGGEELRSTVSAGVATAGGDGQPFEEVLRSADSALYAAKRDGRNRVVAEPLRLVG
jgi:diguanylate cyclase (GGDEF)-like protein